MTQEVHYDIELATAHHEANMAMLQFTMESFLNGPDARNRHVARAVEVIFDDMEKYLAISIEKLSAAIDRHYNDPGDREVPESNARWADTLVELTERFVNHMNAHFTKGQPLTEQSVFYTLTLSPCAANHAVRTLQGEILARGPDDVRGQAYRQAMLETAEFPPKAEEVVQRMEREGDAKDDRMRRHLQSAINATRDTARIVTAHRGV